MHDQRLGRGLIAVSVRFLDMCRHGLYSDKPYDRVRLASQEYANL